MAQGREGDRAPGQGGKEGGWRAALRGAGVYKHYLRPDLATERGLGVPVGFRVLVREQFRGVPIAPWETVFDGEQHPDETDLNVWGRQLDKADAVNESDVETIDRSDSYSDNDNDDD
jgi:hypothetical protein